MFSRIKARRRVKRSQGMRVSVTLAHFIRNHAFHLMLGIFLTSLIFFGGSSRYDRVVQVPVRLIAVGVLIWATFRSADAAPYAIRFPVILLGGAILLVSLQLIPLPPFIWTALPGRLDFAGVAALAGFAQPWRPLALVPDLAFNALASLTVPAATMYALSVSTIAKNDRINIILLSIVCFSLIIGMLQIVLGSGVITGIYMTGEAPDASGIFANRNHQGLLLAIGFPLLFGWKDLRHGGGRGASARWAGGIFLAVLVIIVIATGSRAGALLSLLGLLGGLAVFWSWFRRHRNARRASRTIILGVVALVAALTSVALVFGRAEAIDRIFSVDPAGDKRIQAIPVLFDMLWAYFPVGSGFGSFDLAFRKAEPFALLDGTYFNQAHNDLIQVIIEGGASGLLLMLAALGWLALATVRLWRDGGTRGEIVQGRAASVALLLMLIASTVDYPLRTPIMMAIACMLTFLMAIGLDSLGEDTPDVD